MKITLASISLRRSPPSGPAAELVSLYVERTSKYMPCVARQFVSETRLLESLQEARGRTRPALVLADSRGQQVTSPELATVLKSLQENGIQELAVAIGPPDGWSATARNRAERLIAFGKITLPHELALVVAAEQIYRALTILAGHPYHSGHERIRPGK